MNMYFSFIAPNEECSHCYFSNNVSKEQGQRSLKDNNNDNKTIHYLKSGPYDLYAQFQVILKSYDSFV